MKQAIYLKIMTENLIKLMKDIKPHVQEFLMNHKQENENHMKSHPFKTTNNL